jgi:hypothetical protein
MEGSYEHDNELFGSVKYWEIPEFLLQVLKHRTLSSVSD